MSFEWSPSVYAHFWSVADNDVSTLFKRSGLSNEVLAQIWGLSNPNNVPNWNPQQFAVAIQLIALAQSGRSPTMNELSAVKSTQMLPIPVFQGVSPPAGVTAPNNPPASQSKNANDGSNWQITQEQKQQYAGFFTNLDTDKDGFVTGQQAQQFFNNSGLPGPVLAKIWSLSDLDKDGNLDIREFCVAMYLVTVVKAGQNMPSSLPQSLIQSVYGNSAQQTQQPPQAAPQAIQQNQVNASWEITVDEASNFNKLYESLDENRTGKVDGQKARVLFLQSKLPNSDLAAIYSLSDVDKDGCLTKPEFFISMKLLRSRLAGIDIPAELPKEFLVLFNQSQGQSVQAQNQFQTQFQQNQYPQNQVPQNQFQQNQTAPQYQNNPQQSQFPQNQVPPQQNQFSQNQIPPQSQSQQNLFAQNQVPQNQYQAPQSQVPQNQHQVPQNQSLQNQVPQNQYQTQPNQFPQQNQYQAQNQNQAPQSQPQNQFFNTMSQSKSNTFSKSSEESKITEMERKVDDLQDRLKSITAQNDQLRTQISVFTKDKTKLEQTCNDATREKRNVESDLRDLKYKYKKTEDKIHESEDKLLQIQNKLTSNPEDTSRLQNALRAKEMEISELRDRITNTDRKYKTRLTDNETKLRELSMNAQRNSSQPKEVNPFLSSGTQPYSIPNDAASSMFNSFMN